MAQAIKVLRRGLVIVYFGDGKGKTTAALGIILRAVGHGYRVALVQFIKSNTNSGELKALRGLANVDIYVGGLGFVGIMGDKRSAEEHKIRAVETLKLATEYLKSGRYYVVVLDEVNCAVNAGLLTSEEVISAVRQRSEFTSVVLTGCKAPEEFIKEADIATEMKKVKHIFDEGYIAKIGIDF